MGSHSDWQLAELFNLLSRTDDTPADAGYFVIADDGTRYSVIAWRICDSHPWGDDPLRYPVTAKGLIFGNPAIMSPDGSVELGGVFAGGGFAGPWRSLEDYQSWISAHPSLPYDMEAA